MKVRNQAAGAALMVQFFRGVRQARRRRLLVICCARCGAALRDDNCPDECTCGVGR